MFEVRRLREEAFRWQRIEVMGHAPSKETLALQGPATHSFS